MEREPYTFPTIEIKNVYDDIEKYVVDDFEIKDYNHYEAIKMEMRK